MRQHVARPHGPRLGAGRRGVALIFVLWLLVLLGVVASEVVARSRLETQLLSNIRSRTAGRYAAESGILVAKTSIEALLDSTDVADRAAVFQQINTLVPSSRDVEIGDARFRVAVVELNARLDLNRTDAVTLKGLFSEFTSESRAEAIVAAIKQEPLMRLAELGRLPGVDDSLALSVAPYLTVWGDGLVDINAAPAAVLAAVPQIGPAAARSIVRRRDAGEVFSSPGDIAHKSASAAAPSASGAGGGSGPLLIAIPTRVMLVSRGWLQGHPMTHEIQAVYSIVGHLLVLQNWEERDR
jgi:type II secretory pathway component PulK